MQRGSGDQAATKKRKKTHGKRSRSAVSLSAEPEEENSTTGEPEEDEHEHESDSQQALSTTHALVIGLPTKCTPFVAPNVTAAFVQL